MDCRIIDSYDEISHKIPTEWSHDVVQMGNHVPGSFDWVLALHSAVLLTIRVHLESLEAHLYFLC